jgi:hypothetical protein
LPPESHKLPFGIGYHVLGFDRLQSRLAPLQASRRLAFSQQSGTL